jgi:hypothetical protein
MLKRLIIAVFGIGLIIVLSSTAFAGPGTPGQPGNDNAPDLHKPSAPLYGTPVSSARPAEPSFKKPASAKKVLPPGTQDPGTPSLIYFCDVQDYSGAIAYYWTIPDAFGDDLFNTRFTVEDGFNCTLKVAHFLMYEPVTTGTPGMRAYLWADDGFGFPGAVLDSVDFTNGDIVAAYAPAGNLSYLSADFSAAGWVFSDGDEYHYGWTVLGGAGDTLANISDDGYGPYAGEARSSEYSGGLWGTMLSDWGGGIEDYTFVILSERCCSEIPFSDCYVQSYWQNIAFFWRSPHQTYGFNEYASRFDVTGPETLQSVSFYIYNSTASGGDPVGNQDIYVKIYDDDGANLPGTLITSATVTAGSYSFFPSLTTVVFAPQMVTNTFHVSLSTNGTWDGAAGLGPGDTFESFLSSDGTDLTGRSSYLWTGVWYSALDLYGTDYAFLIDVYTCKDEFSDCSVQNWTGGIVDDSRAIPDGNPALLWAQKFFNTPGGAECELRKLKLHFVRLAADITAGRDSMYTYPTDIQIKTDNAGYPNGALLHQVTLTPADYAAAGFTGPAYTGDFYISLDLTVSIPTQFWVVVDPQAPSRPFGIRHASNLFAGGGGNVDGMATLYGVDSMYYTVFEFFGTPDDGALDIEAQVCCVPFTGADCNPPDDNWSSRGHDLARTGRSQLAIGDAWCDLNVDWFADDTDPAATAQTMGPIIHDGRVYQVLETGAVGSRIRVFDLYDGTPIGTITGAALGNFVENDPVLVGSKLYIAGGDNRIVSRWDISGPGVPGAPDWTTTIAAAAGPLRRCQLLMVDVGGTLVLSGGSQLGRAFALTEATGVLYPGWATNPITLDAGQLVQTSATDGSQLFFGTRQAGLDGDVWSINPATGAMNWKLSTSGGRQGNAVWPGAGDPVLTEGFPSMSTDAGVLYVNSNCQTSNADGVFYRLNAGTGALLSATKAHATVFANPIIDINLIYQQGTTRFSSGGPYDGDMVAYSKTTGAAVWESEDYIEHGVLNGTLRRYFNNGLLTCEPEPDPDIIVNADERGFLHFWNSITGEEFFRRRWDFGIGAASIAGGTAIGTDTSGTIHVLSGSSRGALVSLAKGADRPRLEIQDIDPNIGVEFSVSVSEIYSAPNIIVNTGCADLTFTAVNVDTATFGPSDPGLSPFVPVRPELLSTAALLADEMAINAAQFKFKETVSDENIVAVNMVTTDEQSLRNERNYRAALVLPAYLNGVLSPFTGQVVAAGDSIDLDLDVNPSLINRGPQTFYIELQTDDPDYFVNGGSVALPNDYPELVVTLVGGCLGDTTYLHFGIGGDDFAPIANTVRLADSDWSPTGTEYNGEGGYIFQGTYDFGVSTERIAMNVKNWFGQPEENSWVSVQADPNYCNNDCKPALITGVALGSLWNGASYDPIVGNMVCKSWVDSVQDFGLGVLANWNWRNYGAPFSDSLSMGVIANTRSIGVEGVPEFENFFVEIFEITNRSAVNGIPGWKFGSHIDYDASRFVLGGSHDSLIYDQGSSATWTTSSVNPAADYAFGQVKLPFGCGHTPMVNGMALDSDQGQFESDPTIGRGDPFWDSCYFYLSLPQGTERAHSINGAAQDEQSHSTLVWHDFAPSETITFAAVSFGFDAGVTDPWADGGGGEISALANFANKWVGFGRGDVNDDNAINLGDIMTLADIVGGSVPGAIPFAHLGDVDADGDVDNADLNYLINYYFGCGPCPVGAWMF